MTTHRMDDYPAVWPKMNTAPCALAPTWRTLSVGSFPRVRVVKAIFGSWCTTYTPSSMPYWPKQLPGRIPICTDRSEDAGDSPNGRKAHMMTKHWLTPTRPSHNVWYRWRCWDCGQFLPPGTEAVTSQVPGTAGGALIFHPACMGTGMEHAMAGWMPQWLR